jgi:hypothetical protein
MHLLLPTHVFFGLVLLSIRYLSSDETVVQLDGMVLLDRDTVDRYGQVWMGDCWIGTR